MFEKPDAKPRMHRYSAGITTDRPTGFYPESMPKTSKIVFDDCYEYYNTHSITKITYTVSSSATCLKCGANVPQFRPARSGDTTTQANLCQARIAFATLRSLVFSSPFLPPIGTQYPGQTPIIRGCSSLVRVSFSIRSAPRWPPSFHAKARVAKAAPENSASVPNNGGTSSRVSHLLFPPTRCVVRGLSDSLRAFSIFP